MNEEVRKLQLIEGILKTKDEEVLREAENVLAKNRLTLAAAVTTEQQYQKQNKYLSNQLFQNPLFLLISVHHFIRIAV